MCRWKHYLKKNNFRRWVLSRSAKQSGLQSRVCCLPSEQCSERWCRYINSRLMLFDSHSIVCMIFVKCSWLDCQRRLTRLTRFASLTTCWYFSIFLFFYFTFKTNSNHHFYRLHYLLLLDAFWLPILASVDFWWCIRFTTSKQAVFFYAKKFNL